MSTSDYSKTPTITTYDNRHLAVRTLSGVAIRTRRRRRRSAPPTVSMMHVVFYHRAQIPDWRLPG